MKVPLIQTRAVWVWYGFILRVLLKPLIFPFSFFEDGPPPCSPSKVRWLKAYNKVRVQLLEVGRLYLPSSSAALLICFILTYIQTYSRSNTDMLLLSLSLSLYLFPPLWVAWVSVMPQQFAPISCSLWIFALMWNTSFQHGRLQIQLSLRCYRKFLVLKIWHLELKWFNASNNKCGLPMQGDKSVSLVLAFAACSCTVGSRHMFEVWLMLKKLWDICHHSCFGV